MIPGLQKLVCWNCKSLTEIPVIYGLKTLICWNCKSLTEIPLIPGLKKLKCNTCTSLTKIPVIPGLKILFCDGCTSLTEIPVILGLNILEFNNCPWLKHFSNLQYKSNLTQLVKIQKWFKIRVSKKPGVRKYILGKNELGKLLETLIPSLIEKYYCPNGKGAFLAKCEFKKLKLNNFNFFKNNIKCVKYVKKKIYLDSKN